MTDDALARFEEKVELIPFSTCWWWIAHTDRKGYGQFQVGRRLDGSRRTARAHRLSYEHFIGQIPVGLTIDHLCHNPGCVNPAHLEAVTNKENVLRGVGLTAQQARQTHCKRGHPFDDNGTYRKPGSNMRECRTCKIMLQRQRRNGRVVR